MEKFSIFELSLSTSRIRFIGIGRADDGDNTIKHLIIEENERISILVNNFNPQSKHEQSNDIRQALAGTELLFIAVNISNQTAVELASKIAKIAKDLGVLTIAIATDTKSMSCEENLNIKFSDKDVERLKSEADVTFLVPNMNNFRCTNPNLLIKGEESEVLLTQFRRIINTVTGIILDHGEDDITLDIADIKSVMKDSKMAFISIGEHMGKNAAFKAVNNAIDTIKSEHMSMKNASGVAVHFTMNPNFHFMELSSAMEVIHNSVNESARVIFGTTTNKKLPLDFIRVTVIATEKKSIMVANNVY
jgi:cell division protein FtsZ